MLRGQKMVTLVYGIMLTALMLIGGLGLNLELGLLIAGIICTIGLLGLKLRGEAIRFPTGFMIFSGGILLLIISLGWSRNLESSLYWMFLMASAGLWWLLSFNLKPKLNWLTSGWLIWLGILFGLVEVVMALRGKEVVDSSSLIGYASNFLNHRHIGDWWALVGIYGVNRMRQRITLGNVLLLAVAAVMVIWAVSRSAILTWMVGGGILMAGKVETVWAKRGRMILLLSLVGIFLWVSSSKSIMQSRPYFGQVMQGLGRHPLGVGMGNFKVISAEAVQKDVGMANFALNAHSWPLEYLAGMGVLGLVFIWWFAEQGLMVVNNLRSEASLEKALWLALFVNLSVDTTYLVPTMIWLWFWLLGRLSTEEKTKWRSKLCLGLMVGVMVVGVGWILMQNFSTPGL
jgi:hypothetical protein